MSCQSCIDSTHVAWQRIYIVRNGGYRSIIAASILKQRGWDNFVDVSDGFVGIKNTQLPKTNYVCPTTLL